MAKSTDRYIVSIPGMRAIRVRDNCCHYFMEADGVEYWNMRLEHVEALEQLFAKVTADMVALGQSDGVEVVRTPAARPAARGKK